MNAERQLIGALLLDQARYDDISYVKSFMFQDMVLKDIYSMYEDGTEVNPLVIGQTIKGIPRQQLDELLETLVMEHDGSISDKSCAEEILREYKSRQLNDYLGRLSVNPQNVNAVFDDLNRFLNDYQTIEDGSEIRTLSELTSYQGDYFSPKNEKNLKFGFEIIDKSIGGLDPGDVTIIAARPGVGKSAFALQVIRKFGRDGNKTGYFNLEMASKQIYERAVASASGIALNNIRLNTTFHNNEQSLFTEGNKQLQKENNVYVISGTQTLTNIRKIQRKYGFQIIVIDYLQLIKTETKRNGNRAAEVGDISRGLKALARDFNIPVIALSQLNRVSEQLRDKEPSMSELRESGDLEQDASTILMLWNSNPEDYKEKTIKVEKSRNGLCDRMKLYFDGKHMSFSSIDFDNGFRDSTDMGTIPFDL